MAKKDDIKTEDMGNMSDESVNKPADLGNLNPESANKPADLGDLNTKPTKTVDLGRLNLPKFKKFNKGK